MSSAAQQLERVFLCHGKKIRALRMKPGVSMIVRLGQYAYSARSTIGFADTVPAHTVNQNHNMLRCID